MSPQLGPIVFQYRPVGVFGCFFFGILKDLFFVSQMLNGAGLFTYKTG